MNSLEVVRVDEVGRTPVRLAGVIKEYGGGEQAVRALAGVTLELARGTFTAVMGPSGSGKSTLMQCAAGLDQPTSGEVTLVGRRLTGLSEDQLTVLRRERVAFVFQSFNLVPTLTVLQNVRLPLTLAGRRVADAELLRAVERVGLLERCDHLPGQLSGGQQQRVAIARALASRAEVLFADEPTGALDTVTSGRVLRLLRAAVDESGQTIMMTTHDPVAASAADSVVFLVDGQITGRMHAPTPARVAEELARIGERTARPVGRI
ncbi:ABC transporter ATP-binding protein [Allokutzneria sp. NRRL B-24872]|uniref:ABC transporter ATP-binding protein n=1 Tax=Allokutzneria sp. NRRL B-24872 TaxID=1137961 RepID=UPI000A37319C|nr:ABC transporter ATP-binding protein [Allokutzneria sp. NRRL B-24872]